MFYLLESPVFCNLIMKAMFDDSQFTMFLNYLSTSVIFVAIGIEIFRHVQYEQLRLNRPGHFGFGITVHMTATMCSVIILKANFIFGRRKTSVFAGLLHTSMFLFLAAGANLAITMEEMGVRRSVMTLREDVLTFIVCMVIHFVGIIHSMLINVA